MRTKFLKLVCSLALGPVICMAGRASATGVSFGHLENCGSCSQESAENRPYRPAPEVFPRAAAPPGCVNTVAISRPGNVFETPGIHALSSGCSVDGPSVSLAKATAPHLLRNDPARSLPPAGAASSPLPSDWHIVTGSAPGGAPSAVDHGSGGWSHGDATSPFHPHPSVLLLASGLVGLACLRRSKKRAA
jgi:hypothetical protein